MSFVPAILSLKAGFQLNLRGFTGSENGKEEWLAQFGITGCWSL